MNATQTTAPMSIEVEAPAQVPQLSQSPPSPKTVVSYADGTAQTPVTAPTPTALAIPTPTLVMPENLDADCAKNEYLRYVRSIIGDHPEPSKWIEQLKTALMRDYGLDVEVENSSYILKKTEHADITKEFVRKFRGLIGYTYRPFEIACMSLPVTLNVKDDKIDPDTLKTTLRDHSYAVYPLYDATLIRMVRFDNGYTISTNKKIDADKSHWVSDKSYETLFKESANLLRFDPSPMKLGCTYLFLLIHPENKMVVPYSGCSIIHIATIDHDTTKEVFDRIDGVPQPEPVQVSLDNVFKTLTAEAPLRDCFIGYIVKDHTTGITYRFDTQTFTTAKKLQYNNAQPLYRFIYNLKNDTLPEYMTYYPEHVGTFTTYMMKLNALMDHLLDVYKHIHVYQHKDFVYNKTFSRFLYDLHGYYRDHIKPMGVTASGRKAVVTAEVLYQFIKKSDVPRIAHLMNSWAEMNS